MSKFKIRKKHQPVRESEKYREVKPKRRIAWVRIIIFLVIPFVAIFLFASYTTAQNQEAMVEEYYAEFSDTSSIYLYVNVQHPLEPDYVPNELTTVELPTYGKTEGETIQMQKEAYDALTEMFAAAEKDGINLMVGSAYRSFDYQWTTYYGWVDQLGATEASKVSAKPGSSEHQTGLAVDLFSEDADPNCYLETCFDESEAYDWLINNSYKYGFVLRYPEDKTSETNFSYEPWHYRYVGKDLATYLYENNLTLDAYYKQVEELASQEEYPTFVMPFSSAKPPGM